MPSEKIDTLREPPVALQDRDALKHAVHTAVILLRRLMRFKLTLGNQIQRATAAYEAKVAEVNTTLQPLLDQIFWDVFVHWDELLSGRATETVILPDAEFVRRIDKVGTLTIDENIVIPYLLGLRQSDMVKNLRAKLGNADVDRLLDELEQLVDTETVTVHSISKDNKRKLKEILMRRGDIPIAGAQVQLNHTLTMAPNSSAVATVYIQKPAVVKRRLPNP